MTRLEYERVKGRLVRHGVCPMCGSPFDLERVNTLVLSCSNPTCGAFYRPTLNERFDLSRGQELPAAGPARLPERDS